MNLFVSALIKGEDNMEELAKWIDKQEIPNLGVELIAFTHDKDYWERLKSILNTITCPVSFHGPYIGVEATSKPGTEEYDWLIESYKRVFSLAQKHNVRHIVFHYSQLGFSEEDLNEAQQISKENIRTIMKLAEEYNVNMLIENLAYPKGKLTLYDNKEYSEIFSENKDALSIIDIGHAHINKMDIEAFLKEHSTKVKAYHFHNNNGKDDQHNSLKDGSINYKAILDLFKKYTPESDIVLEYEPHTKLSNQDLLQEINFIFDNVLN